MIGQSELKAEVSCPAGKRVVAGGFSLAPGSLARWLSLLTSYPVFGGATEGWVVGGATGSVVGSSSTAAGSSARPNR